MTILSRVLGFVRDVLIAAVLGTSSVADAFFVAFRVPNMFRRLFAEGAFDAAFIPLFARRLHDRRARGGARLRRPGAFRPHGPARSPSPCSPRSPCPGSCCCWRLASAATPRSSISRCCSRASRCLISSACRWSRSIPACSNALGRFAIAAFTPSLLNVVLIAVLLGLIATGNFDQSASGRGARLGRRRLGRVAGRRGGSRPPREIGMQRAFAATAPHARHAAPDRARRARHRRRRHGAAHRA